MLTVVLALAAYAGTDAQADRLARAAAPHPAVVAAATPPRPRLQLDLSDLMDEEAVENGAPAPRRAQRLDPWVASMISNVRIEAVPAARSAGQRRAAPRQVASRQVVPQAQRAAARDYPPGRW